MTDETGNDFGMKCPKCGASDEIDVCAEGIAAPGFERLDGETTSTMSLSGVSAQPWKLPTRQALTLNATPFDDLQLRSSKTASRKLVIFTPQLTALPISLTTSFAP